MSVSMKALRDAVNELDCRLEHGAGLAQLREQLDVVKQKVRSLGDTKPPADHVNTEMMVEYLETVGLTGIAHRLAALFHGAFEVEPALPSRDDVVAAFIGPQGSYLADSAINVTRDGTWWTLDGKKWEVVYEPMETKPI